MPVRHGNWDIKSPSWLLSFFLGASLLVFGVIGLIAPELASRIYGTPFVMDWAQNFYQAKAIRDLVMSAFLLAAVFGRYRRLALYINLGGIPISVCDLFVVARTVPENWVQIFFLHGLTVLALVVVVALLRKEMAEYRARIMALGMGSGPAAGAGVGSGAAAGAGVGSGMGARATAGSHGEWTRVEEKPAEERSRERNHPILQT